MQMLKEAEEKITESGGVLNLVSSVNAPPSETADGKDALGWIWRILGSAVVKPLSLKHSSQVFKKKAMRE